MKLINLLHVDDDEKYARQVNERIKKAFANISPDFALSNNEALSKLSSYPFDAVLYDVGLDKDESWSVARKIKDLQPGTILIGLSLSMDVYKFQRISFPLCFNELASTLSFTSNYLMFIPKYLAKYGMTAEHSEIGKKLLQS